MNFKKIFSLSLFVTLLHLTSFAGNTFPCIEGTTISTTEGETAVVLSCDGTGADGIIRVVTSNHSMPFAFAVIDQNDIILSVGLSQNIDLSQFTGNVQIYAFSYLGTILAQVGDNLFGIELASFCYELTDNFVSITNADLDGGSIQLDNGETTTTVCVNDGADDILHFNSIDAAGGTNFTYIVTDEANNILSIPAGDTQNFEGAPQGICHVWGLVYDGDLLAEVGDNVNTANLSTSCYGLSDNFITVNRQAVLAGQISFNDNNDSFYELCSNSGQNEIGMSVTGNTGDKYAYIITNTNGDIETIIDPATNYIPQIGFSNTRYIYGIAYSGSAYTPTEIQELITQNINDAVLRDNCFDLSVPIELQVSVVDGGGIQLADGTTVVFICSNDIDNGIIVLQNSSDPNTTQAYVLTDVNNNIITFLTGNTVNLTIAAAGQYKIWSISYTGDLVGEINDPLMNVALSDGCYDISGNSVSITKKDVDSGTLAFDDGSTDRILCPEGNGSSIVNFNSEGATGQSYTYILTDEEGIIIENFNDNSFDFVGSLASGIVHFWGVSYTGTFDLSFGENISDAVLSDDCYDVTNYVEVIYEVAYAGIISTPDGTTDFEFCVGDGASDVIDFVVTEANHLNYAYLITTTDGVLIEIIMDDSFDFENITGGDARVYGLSYTGILTIIPGDNIFSSIISSDCADITENFISLTKTDVDGGSIFTSFLDNVIYVCAGDGEADNIEFFNNSTADDANYTYVLTNEDGVILVVLDDNTYDFETNVTRTYHLWGISYTGDFLAGFGDNISTAELAEGCYTFSNNHLTIVQDLPDAGLISTIDGETEVSLCIGAESGIITFETTSTSTAGYAYFLLNLDGEILEIHDGVNTIDFTMIDTGSYQVQGISYTGILLAGIGEVAATTDLATSCFELSENLIDILREPAVDGGIISILDNPATTIYTCPSDDVADLYIFQSNSTDEDLWYVITDEFNNIIIPQIVSPAIDFDAASPGIYRVYGISINGNSNIAFGVNVLEDELSDRCYAPSDNFITIVVMTPAGGTVTSDQGMVVDITVGDGIADTLTFSNIDASSTLYTYIITDENNEIIGFVADNMHDFENAPAGICRVWGLAHTSGDILADIGDILTDITVTDDCYSLSENFVTINRTEDGLRNEKSSDELVENKTSLRLSIYPNPATERFTANIEVNNSTTKVSEITVINTNGQVLQHFTTATDNGFNSAEIDIQNLQPGVYVLMVRNEKTQKMIRFIKQ